MHPLLLSGLLLGVGLLIAIVGRAWRHGRHPVCRGCGFHLAGLNAPSACPECGRDLTRRRAIAAGDRRRWPVPAVLVLVALGVLSLGYAVLDDPALDARKPVWMLDVERRAFGESRDGRTRDEIKRRLDAVPTSAQEQRALASIAMRYAGEPAAHIDWHNLSTRVISSGWVDQGTARPHVLDVLEEFLAGDAPRREVMKDNCARYLQLVPIERSAVDALLDLVEREHRLAVESDDRERLKAWALSPEREVLSAWGERNWDELSFDDQVRLAGDISGRVRFEVDPYVRVGDETRLTFTVNRLPLVFADRAWTSIEIVEVRAGDEVHRQRRYGLGGGGGAGIDSWTGLSTLITLGSTVPAGPVAIEADLRVGHHITDHAEDVQFGMRDGVEQENQWPLVTVQASTVALPADTPDATVLLAPAELHEQVLDRLEMAPLQRDEDGMVSVSIRLNRAPIDIDHRLVMTQGDAEAELGQLRVNANSTTHSGFSRQPAGDAIDLASPVSLALVPRSTIAVGVDGEAGVGGRFELGLFQIDLSQGGFMNEAPRPIRAVRIGASDSSSSE
ncbi:MAG: hypothetical protein AAFR76_03800 [Planctomycetota bacterium]